MATVEIERACGHVESVGIFGKMADRSRQEVYEASRLCYECYQAKRLADRDAENAAAAEANQSAALPALVGSEKQIAWAEKLRADVLKDVAERVEHARVQLPGAVEAGKVCKEEADQIRAACEKIEAGLKTQDSAKWWIENCREGFYFNGALDAECADLKAERKARKAAQQEQAAIDAQAQRQMERLAENAAMAAEESRAAAAASDFVPASALVRYDNVTITATDGRTAKAFVDEGDWCVYQVDGAALSSDSPDAARIAREAKAL